MASSKASAATSKELPGRRRLIDTPLSRPKLEPKAAPAQARAARPAIPRAVTRRRSDTRHAARGLVGDPLVGLGARHAPSASAVRSSASHHAEQRNWPRSRAYASSSCLPVGRPLGHRYSSASR